LRSEISRLKELGVKLALDDFGTDYSSLGYLTQLPFDHLKIDRIFVEGVAQSDRRRELLKGIVALGHGLGMSVVGEGAETPEEIEVLTLLGCDVAQGYVLARPLPPAQALEAASKFELPKRTNGVHALQHRLTSDAR
jgi:EAL domain-containing protein (putative c-di-GMP-specific phosphodiesterase class I)